MLQLPPYPFTVFSAIVSRMKATHVQWRTRFIKMWKNINFYNNLRTAYKPRFLVGKEEGTPTNRFYSRIVAANLFCTANFDDISGQQMIVRSNRCQQQYRLHKTIKIYVLKFRTFGPIFFPSIFLFDFVVAILFLIYNKLDPFLSFANLCAAKKQTTRDNILIRLKGVKSIKKHNYIHTYGIHDRYGRLSAFGQKIKCRFVK